MKGGSPYEARMALEKYKQAYEELRLALIARAEAYERKAAASSGLTVEEYRDRESNWSTYKF